MKRKPSTSSESSESSEDTIRESKRRRKPKTPVFNRKLTTKKIEILSSGKNLTGKILSKNGEDLFGMLRFIQKNPRKKLLDLLLENQKKIQKTMIEMERVDYPIFLKAKNILSKLFGREDFIYSIYRYLPLSDKEIRKLYREAKHWNLTEYQKGVLLFYTITHNAFL